MEIALSRTLIQSGLTWKEVKERTGITQAVYYQIKRGFKPVHKDFGCIVCNGKRLVKLFCQNHYYTYVESIRYKNRRKLKAA